MVRFESDLQRELVPEWRAKYFDYKLGKQKIKACTRAIDKANRTPRFFPTPSSRRQRRPSNAEQTFTPASTFPRPSQDGNEQGLSPRAEDDGSPFTPHPRARKAPGAQQSLQSPLGKSKQRDRLAPSTETQPLKSPRAAEQGSGSYGSIGSTPQTGPSFKLRRFSEDAFEAIRAQFGSPGSRKSGSALWNARSKPISKGPPALKLPEPALASNRDDQDFHGGEIVPSQTSTGAEIDRGSTRVDSGSQHFEDAGPPRRSFSTPYAVPRRRPTLVDRVLSTYSYRGPPRYGIPLEAYQEFDTRQAEFFRFLDEEFEKIETFYRLKEDESTRRLESLQAQLEMMKSRQPEEQRRRRNDAPARSRSSANGRGHPQNTHEDRGASNSRWTNRITPNIYFWRSSEGESGNQTDSSGVTRLLDDVPYKDAKSILKQALQEFYKNLEMLKSYAAINRTAFRKINKKYDKALNTRQTGKFMSEKVDQAWFVQSHVLESHIQDVEDLYARFFAKGSHKIAVRKLRAKHQSDYTSSAFRNGLLLGAGIVLAIRALMYASAIMEFADPTIMVQTTYLLQLYGGYFLALFLFLLFCLDCRFWLGEKINYVFIFEFDTRHNLDWRQLAEIPCLLWFLFGLCMWLNFKSYGADPMFLYWPVVLVGLTVFLLFAPVKLLYHRSRLWWAASTLRLYAAGFYSVEFRDFLLGDMYCSLTYTMGNIEVFFCLYANNWNDPSQCNSSSSRLLGFLSCLPGIWRTLQCWRRYRDTRMTFPHIANMFKYICTVLFYMSLSLYRIQVAYEEDVSGTVPEPTHTLKTLKAFFIFFATINSIYVSLWDLLIDWSLGHVHARWPLLREPLGFSWPLLYYVAMVIDPILRFNWIFYVAVSDELQHSALLSFFISFSEICRRAFWALFRVENEHMTNVGMFRASRDIPLPYDTSITRATTDEEDEEALNPAGPSGMPTPRRLERVLSTAHAHDFERRRPDHSSSDEEEEDEDHEGSDEERIEREHI